MDSDPFYSLDGPLDSMPSDGQMRSANLSNFPTLIQRMGGDARTILDKHDIDPWLARDPDHYIECKALVNLLEYCSRHFNDPLFGLHLARLQEPDVYGCVTALCRAAPNVRDSIQALMDFIPVVHCPNTEIELLEGNEVAEIRWRVEALPETNTQANYQAVMLNAKLLRQLGGPDFRLSYVNLSVNAPTKIIPELQKQLGCPFKRTQFENAIAFPTEFLKHPVTSANRLLFKLLGGYLENVKTAARKSTSERVQDYVRGALPSGHCSIERCAEKLGVSVRTLQAYLSESGQKFSDILEAQRIDMAKTYLKQHITLDDVAVSLGYSEQSSFGRAFKRWTGSTPKQYRRDLLASGEKGLTSN